MSREEKNLCDSLTSQSFDYIPFCDNEKECYTRVNNLFKTDFKIETDNYLYHFKNHLARSWYYYNKAVIEIKKISKECKDENPNKLPGLVNQSKYYLSESFEEIDKALKKSFEIVKKEKEYLKNQEVSLIKEEKIYDDYLLFEQILLEINTNNYKSDSYASFYAKKIDNFRKSTNYLPKNLIEEDSIFIKISDLSTFFPEEIKEIEEKVKIFSFSESFDNIFDYFKNWFFTSESISELKKLPTKELMILYSDVAGEKNSVTENFFELINNYSGNYNMLKSKENALKSELEKSYFLAETELKKSVTHEDIYFLQKELFSENIIINSNIDETFNKIKNERIVFRQQDLKKDLSFGYKFSEIKDLKNSFDFIYSELLKTNIQSSQKIFEKCKIIAQNNLKLKNELIELRPVYDNLIFNSKILEKKSSLDADLCRKVIELKKEYLEGTNSIEILKAKQIDLTKDCFLYLEEIFSKIKLNELEKMFLILKEEEVTSKNLYYFKESCENIRLQVNNEISDQTKIIELEQKYESLLKIKEDFLLLVSFFGSRQKTIIDKVSAEISFFDEHRKNEFFDIISILGKEDGLIKRIDEKINTFEIVLKKEKIDEIIKNITFENKENIIFDEEVNSEVLITITNPFNSINEEISFTAPFEIDLNRKYLIKDYFKGSEKTLIKLKNVPKGKTYLGGNYKTNLDFEINTTVLYTSNKNSIIEKEIIIKNEEIFRKAFFEINTIKNNKIVVSKDGINQEFIEKDKKISFVLNNVSKSSNIKVYFYTNSLISINTSYLKIKNIDEKNQIIEKELLIKNTSGEKLTADLLIDFVNDFSVEEVNIYDEGFINKRINFIDDYILIKNIKFFGLEEKRFLLVSKISNLRNYYENILNNLKENILEISPELYNKINLHIKLDYSSEWVKKSDKLIDEANKMIFENNILIQKEVDLSLLKNDLNEQLNYLTNSISELEELGLLEDSFKLREFISSIEEEIDSDNLDNLTDLLIKLNDLNFNINNSIIKELNKIEEFLNSGNFDNALFYKKEEILEKINNIKNFEDNPLTINQKFLEIKSMFNELKNNIEKIDGETKDEIKYIKNVIEESFKLIILIEKELSFSNEELIDIKFIKPITNSRLNKLKEKLEELENSDLEKNKSEILNIYNELKSAYNKIKTEAIKRYNIAIDNNESENKLLSAKENIDNNNFVSSMFSLSGTNNSPQVNIIGIIPIIVIIVSLIIFSIYNKKKNKIKNLSNSEIEELWNN